METNFPPASSPKHFPFQSRLMKNYDKMPHGYSDLSGVHGGKEKDRKDREMLVHFFHEIVGCVNMTWKGKHAKS